MKQLTLSVVIPVYNEEQRLPKTFAGLEYFLRPHPFSGVEVIFVDDGSRDKTAELIANFKFRYPVQLVSYAENRGKGYAVREGMRAAQNDYALTLDADMSTGFLELQKMAPFMERGCPVIIGTRKASGASVTRRQSWHRQKMGEGYTLLANFMTGVWVSDFTCGFKCFAREAREKIFKAASIDRWSYDAEVLFLAKRFGFRICEAPVAWENDGDTRVRLGKDIIGSFVDLVKIRFVRRR